jgi:hypothetical protein
VYSVSGRLNTEGNRCLMLSIVPPCRIVKKDFYVELVVPPIIWHLLSNKLQHNTVYLNLSTTRNVSGDISPNIRGS